MITYLTDGKLEVPADFIDRADFVSVLKREFTRRPDIRVVVVNVNDGKLPNRAEELPSNVRVIPLSDWTAARNEVAENARSRDSTRAKCGTYHCRAELSPD